jgi:hypothetical protein
MRAASKQMASNTVLRYVMSRLRPCKACQASDPKHRGACCEAAARSNFGIILASAIWKAFYSTMCTGMTWQL